jgi:hypothetical protein
MRQHRHLSILTVFLSKVIFDGIKGDRVKIVSFHACIEIPSIYLSISDNLMTMKMTMNIP